MKKSVFFIFVTIIAIVMIVVIVKYYNKGNVQELNELQNIALEEINDDIEEKNTKVNNTKKYSKVEASYMLDEADEITYSEPEQVDNDEIDDLVQTIFDTVENGEEYVSEKSGGFFEGSPELYIYLNDGRVMHVIALDDFEGVNIIKVWYKEDMSDVVIYKIDEKAEKIINSFKKEKNNSKDVSIVEYNKIKDIAIEYRDSDNIKNYKDFVYDLDGDGKDETITIRNNKEDDNFIYQINGKKFSERYNRTFVYIVDLNKNDKAKEVVIYDEGPSDDPSYEVYSYVDGKMKSQKLFEGAEFYSDENGNFYVTEDVAGLLTPELVIKKYFIEDGVSKENVIDFETIKDKKYYSKETIFFTDDLNKIDKVFESNENREFMEAIEDAGIETLGENDKFIVTGYTSDEYRDICELKVKLDDGRTGYVFGMEHFVD